MKHRQQGLALISVMLVLSLALLITSGLLRSHRLALQSSAQQLQTLHLRQWAMEGEIWALRRLHKSFVEQQNHAEMLRDWPQITPEPGSEDAQVEVQIEDLSARFNLNALLHQGQIDAVTLERWARLLELLELPALRPDRVGLLSEVSQLRLLPGFDAATLLRLEPWVALLPTDATLNINTVPALLLHVLEIEPDIADALVHQRSTTSWHSVQAFSADPLIADTGINTHGLGVDSRWHRITVRVVQEQHVLTLSTDVEFVEKSAQLKVLQRRLLSSRGLEITQ
ncbi:type II secretion system protein GspK [Pseudomonas sp. P1.31]|uniref:type II secretion system protein GspK n=1 Tax=Pseudomonas sp. P1.31 TaxID=1699311 RepID=UPI00069DA46C|nr:type II secretion system protein GspK [Pseudomonas sp. P1.31]